MRLLPLLPALAALPLLTGCGGGGGRVAAAPVTVTLTSTPLLDGTVATGGIIVGLSGDIVVGDYAGGLRGFGSFDLAGIPAGATITSATLTLVQHASSGAPYATLGLLLVDQVVYGNVLEGGAYARSFPTNQGFGTLSTDATLGAKSLVVTAQVQADRAALRTQSQFRLRFAVENDFDTTPDVAVFWSADNAPGPGDCPTLVVAYQP